MNPYALGSCRVVDVASPLVQYQNCQFFGQTTVFLSHITQFTSSAVVFTISAPSTVLSR